MVLPDSNVILPGMSWRAIYHKRIVGTDYNSRALGPIDQLHMVVRNRLLSLKKKSLNTQTCIRIYRNTTIHRDGLLTKKDFNMILKLRP